jgi:hypothetical protein
MQTDQAAKKSWILILHVQDISAILRSKTNVVEGVVMLDGCSRVEAVGALAKDRGSPKTDPGALIRAIRFDPSYRGRLLMHLC